MSDFKIRDPDESDLPFIYSTWLNSYRYDSDLGKSCRNGVFFEEYKRVIDGILKSEKTQVRVTCSQIDHSVVFSYVVFEPGVLHYAFTKEAFRRLGLVSKMTAQDPFKYYTHRTKSVETIVKEHDYLVYNPFLLYMKGKS